MMKYTVKSKIYRTLKRTFMVTRKAQVELVLNGNEGEVTVKVGEIDVNTLGEILERVYRVTIEKEETKPVEETTTTTVVEVTTTLEPLLPLTTEVTPLLPVPEDNLDLSNITTTPFVEDDEDSTEVENKQEETTTVSPKKDKGTKKTNKSK